MYGGCLKGEEWVGGLLVDGMVEVDKVGSFDGGKMKHMCVH